MQNKARTAIAIALALLVGFFAVALFSPLHKHEKGKCSFQGLESCQSDQAAAAFELPSAASTFARNEPAADPASIAGALRARPSRGPPASLAS